MVVHAFIFAGWEREGGKGGGEKEGGEMALLPSSSVFLFPFRTGSGVFTSRGGGVWGKKEKNISSFRLHPCLAAWLIPERRGVLGGKKECRCFPPSLPKEEGKGGHSAPHFPPLHSFYSMGARVKEKGSWRGKGKGGGGGGGKKEFAGFSLPSHYLSFDLVGVKGEGKKEEKGWEASTVCHPPIFFSYSTVYLRGGGFRKRGRRNGDRYSRRPFLCLWGGGGEERKGGGGEDGLDDGCFSSSSSHFTC